MDWVRHWFLECLEQGGFTCEQFDIWGLQQLIGKVKEVWLYLYLQLVNHTVPEIDR